ncbi:MAG TPA: recombinase family protein, partial [Bacteroidia bacterium]|nr:recombinase family protein [Bacteroidia bacterium]
MKTAYQYVRISDDDQSNFSISGQQKMNDDYALKHDIRVLKTFSDDGYSAKDFNRPSWKELEKELSKNKNKVDYLIVWKYDRLIRNAAEGLAFIEKLEQKWNIKLLSVMENFFIDPHSPYFFKSRADLLVNAEFERRVISDRSKF